MLHTNFQDHRRFGYREEDFLRFLAHLSRRLVGELIEEVTGVVRMHVCMFVCVSIFLNSFSSETTGPIETKFHRKPPWDKGTKVYSNGPGQMTKVAAMPIYSKNFKNLLLWNQKADDHETWYAASGARVLLNSFK